MSINLRAIAHTLGILTLIAGSFLGIPLILSYVTGDGQELAFSLSFWIAACTGGMLMYLGQGRRDPHRRDIYVIVSLGWVLVSLVGMLPYLFGGTIVHVSDAFFETVSGFTTTGATTFLHVEGLPHSILLWRSLTQWIGGMGIVVLMIAIMPILGIGGMQLFSAESPGVLVDRIRPRIKETALMMWIVYASLTVSAFVLLWAGGMSAFDAINHSFTTLSTGGFSTRDTSVAAFSPYSQYVIILFMLLAGMNFALLYHGLAGRFRTFFHNEELRYYLLIVFGAALFAWFFLVPGGAGIEPAFRAALFQVVSIVTTTGFVTANYGAWAPPALYVVIMLMFIGGMTGSTAGGIKVMRYLVLVKGVLHEFRQQLHPDAILPIRFNGALIQQSTLYRVMSFVLIYMIILAVSVLVLVLFGIDTQSSLGAAAATLGNIGPGLGTVGPISTYGTVPELAKWYLSFLMIVGRLELFTVLTLFTSYFWRKR
jgi:trk system potassium uptake protein TrkH